MVSKQANSKPAGCRNITASNLCDQLSGLYFDILNKTFWSINLSVWINIIKRRFLHICWLLYLANVNEVKFDPSTTTLHLMSMAKNQIVSWYICIWKKFASKINMHIKAIIRICARVWENREDEKKKKEHKTGYTWNVTQHDSISLK